jgi:Tfp pilus assembly protein PilF
VVASSLVLGSINPVEAASEAAVSRELAKPLKAVQEALMAKQYAEVITKAKAANAIPSKTEYDQYAINEFLASAYAAQGNFPETINYLEANQTSPFTTAAVRQQRVKTLMGLYFQQKKYAKVVEYGAQARASGDNSTDTLQLIANSDYLMGKYKDAMTVMQDIVNRETETAGRPSEKSLKFVWDCANRIDDDAAVGRTVERLLAYYPKQEYWQVAMSSLLQSKGVNDRIALNIYRLANDVGILQRGSDYTEAAQIALDQGNPGEAYSLLQTAFAKNLYTDQRDKDRNQRLFDLAKKKASEDKASLGKYEADAEKMPGGDGLVQVGAAYLGFGQPKQAETAINKGIAKGELKYSDEAYLLLGIAELQQKNMDAARKAFGKVIKDAQYTRLAKLWALRARG